MCAPLMGTYQYLAFVPYIERATHEFLRRLSVNTGENSVKDHLHWYVLTAQILTMLNES